MTLRLIGMLMLLSIGVAHAVQPVEQGLQPILTRLQGISAQQQSLNLLLQSNSTMPRERAIAYRTYKQVDQERLELECSLERARRIGKLPFVTYASPGAEASCKEKADAPVRKH